MLIPALILGPIVLGFGTLLIPRRAETAIKWYACAVAFVVMLGTIASATAPDATVRWLSRPFEATFHVGWTGIGYWLGVMLAVVTLCALIPARAPVISERIETEFRTASGITDGKGHSIAGVVLITAGYSADGKYSHYFVSQVPLKVGDFLLPPGQYLIGWVRGQDSLKVTFYLAQSGRAVGQVDATRNLSITRVESFRIWPPADKALIQLGRFTFPYALAPN